MNESISIFRIQTELVPNWKRIGNNDRGHDRRIFS